MSDPKYTLLDVVDEITTTKDDNATPAVIIFLYAGGPETLKTLFLTNDVIVTFTTPERDPYATFRTCPHITRRSSPCMS